VLQRLLSYIRRHGLMRPGDRVGVAVSGGGDSVALLRLLLEARHDLGVVPAVVHFNHKIRGADADADEQFVRELAARFGLEFFCYSADTPAYAAGHRLSLEAAARELRYRFFDELTADRKLERVATAHTRDDQAETVLLRLVRGAGPAGLAGIHPGVGGGISSGGAPLPPVPRIVRPALDLTRAELRAYLRGVGQPWCEDASNQDVSFTRNRLRQEIMPRLRELNPNLDAVLSDTAEIARAEELWWNEILNRLQRDEPMWAKGAHGSLRLRLATLAAQPLAVQRRLLRLLALGHGLRLEFQHVEQIRELVGEASQSHKRLELPQDWDAVRAGQELWFERRSQPGAPPDYEFALPVPGAVDIPQAGLTIAASISSSGERLYPAFARDLRVRNWRPGDRYWPAHTAAPKKLKELLQARHIPREHKVRWPVVVSSHFSPRPGEKWGTVNHGDEVIVWVPGFGLPEQFRLREEATDGVRLTQVPL
jgi:tRNA(Ile)-lysidine synthase